VDIQRGWEHVLACDGLTTHHTVSMKEVNYVFPLYLYPKEGEEKLFSSKVRSENLSPRFRRWLDTKYNHAFTPEQIFGFLYAVLHAPTYREKYSEFLRLDFPRVPFPQKRFDFEALSDLGEALINRHLLRDVPNFKLADFRGRGSNIVQKPQYSSSEKAVHINDTQCFAPIPPDVWEYHIGGYQVLESFLKSRKGRMLSLAEMSAFTQTANVLAFTIEQMRRIDTAYRAAL
jgi:predicted helicase